MMTPEFIGWLDVKMEQHGAAKVVPPAATVGAEMAERLADHTRRIVTERILREARSRSRSGRRGAYPFRTTGKDAG